MAVIKGSVTGTGWDVIAAANAGKVIPYQTDGTPIVPKYDGVYTVRLEIIPTVLTAGVTFFAMRNLGSRRAFLSKIFLKWGFSGTAALSRSIFEIERFSAATPTLGTALTAIKLNNTYPASSVTDIRFAPGGLTTTGVVFEAPWFLLGHTNQVSIDADVRLEMSENEQDAFMIDVNEGFALRANTALVLGSYLTGTIMWKERT